MHRILSRRTPLKLPRASDMGACARLRVYVQACRGTWSMTPSTTPHRRHRRCPYAGRPRRPSSPANTPKPRTCGGSRHHCLLSSFPSSPVPMEPSAVFFPFSNLALAPFGLFVAAAADERTALSTCCSRTSLATGRPAFLYGAQGLWHHPVRDVHKGCPAGENVSWLIPVAPLRPLHHQLRACYTSRIRL